MTELDKMLNSVCRYTQCSPKKIKGEDRTKKYSLSRFLFFGVASKHGYRDYVISMYLNRKGSVAYYYRTMFHKLVATNDEFRNKFLKISEKYENLISNN